MSGRTLFMTLMLCACIVGILFFYVEQRARTNTGLLEVAYLDVGQGDATLIESPSGTQVLIDGGPNAGVLRAVGKRLGFFDRDIDLIIATHPDLDHIGGLIDVLRRYHVTTILMTENESDTPASDRFREMAEAEGAKIINARRGQVFDIGLGSAGSTTLTILFPDRDPTGLESNTSSIVARLSYGASDFLFTGDSPIAIEEYLVSLDGGYLQSEILKAGHHGSRTSSSESFVEVVDPEYAIISAGKDNRYGHPHKEVMGVFSKLGVNTKNTAEAGSIIFESDGVSIWIK